MSNHSIQLAYPDGFTLPADVKTVFTTGPNNGHDQQAGMYVGIPSISLSNAQSVPVCGLIHCAGYDSALIHPVCTATQQTNTISVYGFWGFQESGDTPNRYICHLITSSALGTLTGPPMTSPGGTAYVGMGTVAAPSSGISLALDRIGPGPAASAPASTAVAGSATGSANASIATLSIPFLNGADYLAVLYTVNGAGGVSAQQNCYVILTEQERY